MMMIYTQIILDIHSKVQTFDKIVQKTSFLTFSGVKMCDKMAISAYILEIVEKDPFLRVQMRAKEDLNRHQLFSTNKQYVKVKLMQNETNR